jgi:hypothetical protein
VAYVSNSARWSNSRVKRVGTRKRLLIALAGAGIVAATIVAAAWASTDVFFVGTGWPSCAERVWPRSDQIDDGWSYNALAGTDNLANGCTEEPAGGSVQAYLEQPSGAFACSSVGWGGIYCTTTNGAFVYTRGHCVNLDFQSIRWMQCWKLKQ